MSKNTLFAQNLIFATLFAFLAITFTAQAEEAIPSGFKFLDSTPAPGQVLGTTTIPSFPNPDMPPMVQKIKEAKELLKSVKLNYQLTPVYTKNKKTGKSAVSSYKLGLRDLYVAILDPATGKIEL